MGRASSATVDNATNRAHPSLPADDTGRAIPVLASGFTHTVTVSGTAARTAVDFSATCKVITIQVTGTAIRYLIGDDTVVVTDTAGDGHPVLLDGGSRDEPIWEDGGGLSGDTIHDRISIIAVGGGSGTAYVTERE